METRYVAPQLLVSAQPQTPRYSVQEERRKPITQSSAGWYPDPHSKAGQLRWWDGAKWSEDQTKDAPVGSSRRDFRAFALLLLALALAAVVAISLLV